MSEVTIRGHSDDCIEVEGDLREEYDAYDCSRHLVFNDGTAVRCEYSPEHYSGKWEIKVVRRGTAKSKRVKAANDDDDYSDMVKLTGDVSHVECWDGLEPTREELLSAIDMVGADDLSDDQLQRMYAITKE